MFAAAYVKDRRKAAGFSARTFGLAIGASGRMVRRYESGEVEPQLSTAGLMARALGVPLDTLYVHDEDATDSAAGREENTRATTTATRR